jgi:hypothetical protein
MPIFTSANAAPLYVAHTPVATSAALIHRNADFIPLLYAPMFEWIRMSQRPTRWSANGECSGRVPQAASALKALNLWGKTPGAAREKKARFIQCGATQEGALKKMSFQRKK